MSHLSHISHVASKYSVKSENMSHLLGDPDDLENTLAEHRHQLADGQSTYADYSELMQIQRTNSEETQRSRCHRIFCWSGPFIHIKLFPLLLADLVVVGLIILFNTVSPLKEQTLGTVSVWWILTFVLIWTNSYFASQIVVRLLILFFRIVTKSSKFLYYSTSMTTPLSLSLWSIALLASWPAMLEFNAEWSEYTRIAFTMLVILTVTYYFRFFLLKLTLSYRDQRHIWLRINESISKERILEKLVNGPIRADPSLNGTRLLAGAQRIRRNSDTGAVEGEDYFERQGCRGCCRQVEGEDVSLFSKLKLQILEFENMSIKVHTKASRVMKPKKWKQNYEGIIDDSPSPHEIALESAAKQVSYMLFDKLTRRQVGPKILSAPEAKKSKRIFFMVEDFYPYFATNQKAVLAFSVFNGSANLQGFVTRKEMTKTITAIYKERKNLSRTIRDSSEIGKILGAILNVLVFIVMGLSFLTLIGVDFQTYLVPYITLILSFTFVFGNTFSQAFNSFIFIFFVNSYDTGDLVHLHNDFAVIDKISLLTTNAVLLDGREITLNNSQLLHTEIVNYTRSRFYAFSFSVFCDIRTPMNQIKAFQEEVVAYSKAHPNVWKLILANLKDVEHSRNVRIGIWAETGPSITWAVWAYHNPKNNFISHVLEMMEKHQIRGNLVPQPVILSHKNSPEPYSSSSSSLEEESISPTSTNSHATRRPPQSTERRSHGGSHQLRQRQRQRRGRTRAEKGRNGAESYIPAKARKGTSMSRRRGGMLSPRRLGEIMGGGGRRDDDGNDEFGFAFGISEDASLHRHSHDSNSSESGSPGPTLSMIESRSHYSTPPTPSSMGFKSIKNE